MATAPTKRRVKPAKQSSTNRVDAVFIRKSGKQQEDAAQIANVKTMLAAKGISVPESTWFVCTVGRRWVTKNEVFIRLIGLIEANKIGTVYIEDQKRWGTKSSTQLFKYISKFREHKSQLYDLRNNRYLTASDVFSEIMAVLKSHESQTELKDLAFRPLRSKVNNFKERGTWPTGTHPFGFGKRLYEADGTTLIWEWQPISRTRGHLFYADENGKLKAGPKNVSIPAKKKGMSQITKLVPSNDKEFIKSIRLIFEYFVKQNLSYRQIMIRLNGADRKFYSRPFTHSLVREIVHNPAYVGDTHYGKVQSGELCSFSPAGEMVEMMDTETDEVLPIKKRAIEDRIVKLNTHKGVIDRELWNDAQKKIKDAEERPSFSPRKAEYYLKPILICGHCGKNMTGGTEGQGDKKIVTYMCSTYRSGKSRDQKVKCGAHRITHEDAERLLLDKIKKSKVEFDQLGSATLRASVEQNIDHVDLLRYENAAKEEKLIGEGIEALRAYYKTNYESSSAARKKFEQAANQQYEFFKFDRALFTKQFRVIVRHAEAESVAEAKAKIAKLEKGHTALTSGWGDATEKMREKLKSQAVELESEIEVWKDRTKTVSERLSEIRQTGRDLIRQYSSLLDEWPAMELREKGEALRKIFQTVTLFWQPKFQSNSENPSRPRTTNRNGRYSYKLLTDKIGWQFADLNLAGSS